MRTRPACVAGLCSVLAALVVLDTTPAAAQYDPFAIYPGPKRVDISASGGFLLSSDWSDLVLLGSVSGVTGAFEQVLARDVVVDPGPVFDGAVTYWEGRYGFRAHAGFARSCLATGRTCSELRFGGTSGTAGTVDVDTWIYDVGGAIGLVDYQRGRIVWPYVFLGFGGVTYNLEQTVGPPLTFIERRPPPGTGALIVATEPDQLLIALEELGIETRFALNLGIGTDFRIPFAGGGLGVRLELSDHIHRSPIDIEIANLDGFRPARGDAQVDFGYVHNLRAAAGLVVHFGR
jgi:hypothetical protein